MFRQKSFDEKTATLYLVATPIGNLDEFTTRAISVLEEVDVIAAEDTRNTMKLLNHFHISKKLVAHHAHNEKDSAKGLLRYLEEGKDVAVVSDAGYPLISDPGYEAVRTVLAAGQRRTDFRRKCGNECTGCFRSKTAALLILWFFEKRNKGAM